MDEKEMPTEELDFDMEQPKETRKGKHLKRMKEKYPDRNLDDEEELYGAIGEDYDAYEKTIKDYDDESSKIKEMFDIDGRSAQLFSDMYNGKSPLANYIRLFGPDLKDSLDDPDAADQIAEAERDYMERTLQNKKAEEEYKANIEETLSMLEDYKAGRGLDDDSVDNILAAAIGIVRDGVMGKFTAETLDMISNALNHDKDVAEASETARIAGRNDRITEKLKTSKKGDGTVPLGGKSNPATQTGGQSIFDLAAMAK